MADKEEQTVEVEIARDWWDLEGKRIPAGTRVSVPVSAALEGVEKGALKTVKKGDK